MESQFVCGCAWAEGCCVAREGFCMCLGTIESFGTGVRFWGRFVLRGVCVGGVESGKGVGGRGRVKGGISAGLGP